MSNEQHEVTVYDRVPATARVSVAQVEAYLKRAGWECIGDAWHRNLWFVQSRPLRNIVLSIENIARAEQRQPSAVLADIAREPRS